MTMHKALHQRADIDCQEKRGNRIRLHWRLRGYINMMRRRLYKKEPRNSADNQMPNRTTTEVRK